MKFVKTNHTNSNLNDYFNAARNEKPIFSAEEMVQNVTHSPTPMIKNNLFQKLGATKMIIGSSAVIFVAALSVFFINPADNSNTQDIAMLQDEPAIVQTISEERNENISDTDSQSAQPENIYKSNNSNTETSIEFTPIKKEAKKTKKENNDVLQNSQINVSGIKYIELTPAELKKIQINVTKDGISIISGQNKYDITEYTLLANGEVMMDRYLDDEDIDLTIFPRLVSTIYGNKKLALFYNDSVQVTIIHSVTTNHNEDEVSEEATEQDDGLINDKSTNDEPRIDFSNYITSNKGIDMVIDINKLIPIAVPCPTKDDPDFKFLLWYEVTPKLLAVLPETEKQKLSIELKEAEKGTYCEAPQAGDDLYFDVWRSCNGAIEQMKIAPNPVDEIVNISFILKEEREIVVTLHDLNGNKVATLQTVQSLNKGEQSMSYDISQYPAGMYLVVLQTSNGEQAVQRVIKN